MNLYGCFLRDWNENVETPDTHSFARLSTTVMLIKMGFKKNHRSGPKTIHVIYCSRWSQSVTNDEVIPMPLSSYTRDTKKADDKTSILKHNLTLGNTSKKVTKKIKFAKMSIKKFQLAPSALYI